MGYLTLQDFYTTQDRVQIQLVQNNFAKFTKSWDEALAIVISHLTQKYDVNTEFTDTENWSSSKVYGARSRIVIDGYNTWAANTAYVVGDCVLHQGYGYVCNTANSDATFQSGKWDNLGARYTMYYGKYPTACKLNGLPIVPTLANPDAPMFDYLNYYAKDDIVWWKGYTYKAKQATESISQEQLIQYYAYSNVPYLNVWPDDPVNNKDSKFWYEKTIYSIAAGTLPTNTTWWTAGDNRNANIVSCMKSISIWLLSELVTAGNVPENWEMRYQDAINTLKGYAEGTMTCLIPRRQPAAGMRVRSGGGIKLQNNYP